MAWRAATAGPAPAVADGFVSNLTVRAGSSVVLTPFQGLGALMGWVVTASLARLMADFRATFPNKSRASDGTIGDTAHQAETSGHNPDDTPGSLAEYSDADTKPEVRAIDVDNDLRDPHGTTMEQVVQRLLATPADRDRLMYVIYNRRIWGKRNSWRQEAYTGSSPHTEHAHFSGDPNADEN